MSPAAIALLAIEAFDIALALLALSKTPDSKPILHMIKRGLEFLISRQHPRGDWDASTRPPGGDSYAQRISTSAWAPLALMETSRILSKRSPFPLR